jgi:hypothetical protein
LVCYTGQIRKIHSFGIIPKDGKILDACEPNEETKKCTDQFDENKVLKFLEKNCLDKRECQFNIRDAIDFEKGDENCISDYSQFFTQVFCQHSDDELEWRRDISWFLTIQICVTAVVYLAYIVFLQLNSNALYNQWNKSIHTISDYTVKYKIPIEEFNHYKDNVFPNDQYTNVNYGFSNYMKNNFEKVLSQAGGDMTD